MTSKNKREIDTEVTTEKSESALRSLLCVRLFNSQYLRWLLLYVSLPRLWSPVVWSNFSGDYLCLSLSLPPFLLSAHPSYIHYFLYYFGFSFLIRIISLLS